MLYIENNTFTINSMNTIKIIWIVQLSNTYIKSNKTLNIFPDKKKVHIQI